MTTNMDRIDKICMIDKIILFIMEIL